MAGAFAKLVGARQLVLNHIGARFPAPQDHRRSQKAQREAVMSEIERQASEAWGMGQAQVAVDFMKVEVSALDYNDVHHLREYSRGDGPSGHREGAEHRGGGHRRGGNGHHRGENGYHRGEGSRRGKGGNYQGGDWSGHRGEGSYGRHREASRLHRGESIALEEREYSGEGGYRGEGGHRGEGGGYGGAKRKRF